MLGDTQARPRHFVVAGDYAQARRWCEDNGLDTRSRNVTLVKSADQLRGLVLSASADALHLAYGAESRRDLADVKRNFELATRLP